MAVLGFQLAAARLDLERRLTEAWQLLARDVCEGDRDERLARDERGVLRLLALTGLCLLALRLLLLQPQRVDRVRFC